MGVYLLCAALLTGIALLVMRETRDTSLDDIGELGRQHHTGQDGEAGTSRARQGGRLRPGERRVERGVVRQVDHQGTRERWRRLGGGAGGWHTHASIP